jgi:hypothetical protein
MKPNKNQFTVWNKDNIKADNCQSLWLIKLKSIIKNDVLVVLELKHLKTDTLNPFFVDS